MMEFAKIFGAAVAGGLSVILVLLLAKPLFDAFAEISKQVNVPASLIVGAILLAIVAGIFKKVLGD